MRPFGTSLKRVLEWSSVVYLVALVAGTVALGRISESWWVTVVGLYTPRAVLGLPLPFFGALLGWARSRWALAGQGFALAVWAVPLMGFTLPGPGALVSDRDAPHVRVLSYNVNSAQGGEENIAAEVDRYAPDVVLMQEIGEAGPQLARVMKERFPTVIVSGQFLTATRYPVLSEVDPEKLPFEGHQRSAHYIAITAKTPIGDVAFYNVHPQSPRDAFLRLRGQGLRRELLSGHLFSGDAGAGVEENARLREWQAAGIARAASHEAIPTVIGGDTNLPGLSGALRRQLGRFQDGFDKAGWGLGYTFPTNGSHWPWMRIDRILANDALRFTWFRVGSSRASDHLAVVADLVSK